MQEKTSFLNSGAIKKINLICLVLTIAAVLFFPVKKQIWYDESVSVLCSKGLYYTAGNALTALPSNTSSSLAQKNTISAVFNCTIIDNGNSVIYNEALHLFTTVFGNSLNTYVLLSKICAVLTLIVFFLLANQFLERSLFISLALILFTTDSIFWGMAHEVRAYAMGILFVTLSTLYFYKYMFKSDKALHLFLTGIFAACAVLTHYLSVYIILVLITYLFIIKNASLLKLRNIIAILIPLVTVCIYFYFAAKGFQTMSRQNTTLAAKTNEDAFSIIQVLALSAKFASLNFKIIFPFIKGANIVIFFSAVFIVGIYIVALRLAKTSKERRDLHLLFILGVSSSLFLGALSVKSHHYTALYARYFSFCLPFTTLFTVYALKVIYSNLRIKQIISYSLISLVTIPSIVFFFVALVKYRPSEKYNHITIAKKIQEDKVDKVGIPDWTDAYLIQSFLPKGYKIVYTTDNTLNDFILFHGSSTEIIPVIRINL